MHEFDSIPYLFLHIVSIKVSIIGSSLMRNRTRPFLGLFAVRPMKISHDLNGRKTAGKHARLSEVDIIIRRALNSAGVFSHLEPEGLSRDDGMCPNRATLIL